MVYQLVGDEEGLKLRLEYKAELASDFEVTYDYIIWPKLKPQKLSH